MTEKKLETVLDELFNREAPPSVEECTRAILPYMRKVKSWPSVLRKLADYIEAKPVPVLINNPKMLMGYILAAMEDED